MQRVCRLARLRQEELMDEKQWISEMAHPQFMILQLSALHFPRTKVGRRKLRLFACGCVRVWWDDLVDSRLTDAVVVSERFADGHEDKTSLAAAYERASYRNFHTHPDLVQWRTQRATQMAAQTCHPKPFDAALMVTVYPLDNAQAAEQIKAERDVCDLLRCVFGNPFQKPAFNKKWRTETVVVLAAGIYEDRAFDRLPILADALEEAGCDDPAMLSHLRGDGPHCRGCWVLDLALGKA
jgi:hypothetical protein